MTWNIGPTVNGTPLEPPPAPDLERVPGDAGRGMCRGRGLDGSWPPRRRPERSRWAGRVPRPTGPSGTGGRPEPGAGDAIARCLASRQVSFAPGTSDARLLPGRLCDGWLPLLSLDAAVLSRRTWGMFEGRMVLVTAANRDDVLVQDPGAPARRDWAVPTHHLAAALRSPAETSGTITYLRRV